MKRNNLTIRQTHLARAPGEGKSKYSRKVKAGQQMYGPGCCAHKISPEKIAAAKRGANLSRGNNYEYDGTTAN